jgi:signal transduction histidine kinase/ligand-binding sensor domain-containing protein
LKKKIPYIFLLLVSIAVTGQYRFLHLGIAQGLSQNSVHCIFQDSQGYFWFGTQDGLNRYDAYTFTTYRHSQSDTTSISDNFITAITEDCNHNLWVGTRNGVNCFNRETERFTQIFPEGMDKKYFHNAISKFTSDKSGSTLFFDSRGKLYKTTISPGKNSFVIKQLKTNSQVNSSYELKDEQEIILADSSGLKTCNPENFYSQKYIFTDTAFLHLEGHPLLFEDKQSRWWVVSDHHVMICNLKDKSVFKKIIPAENCHAITEDAEGNTWIGSENGIVVMNPQLEIIGTAVTNHGSSSGISSNNVLSLLCDNSGEMWVGTADGGVNLYNPFQDVFINARKTDGDEKSISDNGIWTVFQDNKKLFVGTTSGLDIFDLKSASFENCKSFSENVSGRTLFDKTREGKPIENVTAIIKDGNGNYWVGTRNRGIEIISADGKILDEFNETNSELSSNTIFHLLVASDGSIWISTIHGLDHYVPMLQSLLPAKQPFEKFFNNPSDPKTIPGNYVISTFEDSQKKIWISTSGGLSMYDPLTKKFNNYNSKYDDKTSLSYNIVTSCMEDSHGNIWVCALGGGINLFDRAKQNFKSFTQEQGLANNVVYGILEDHQGDLWMSTNAGISSFRPSTGTFINYFPNDGIISNEYSQNGFFKSPSGEMFFASPEGLLLFNPKTISRTQKDVPVILSGIAVNYVKKNPYSISTRKSVDLDWTEKAISFEFAALDFNAPEKINYSYKLEGFDNGWVMANPGQRIATYTSLPFGDYVFKVRIRKTNLQWSQSYLNIAVHIKPPFWLSKWFIALEIIFGLFFVISVVRYYSQRQLRIKLRQSEVQRKIQFERERISRDLHDNVGAHLTYIIQSLDNINYRIEKNPAEKQVEKIESLGDFARGTMQQLRETIWAINKETISLEELKDKIRDHLAKFSNTLTETEFSVELKSEGELILKPSQAIHIFRLVQEAINNSIKHASAKKIEVIIEYTPDKILTVSVTDNGKGFDNSKTFDGHYGLENMKSRVKEMGGKFEIISSEDKGTRIIITVPG